MNRIVGVMCVASALVGCSDGPGTFGPGSPGTAEILIGRSGGVSASIVASVAQNAPPVDFAEVGSLELVINRVEAHRIEGGAWIPIDLEPITIDLAQLAEGTAESVATGGLPEGVYNNVRFFLESASVSFLNDVSVGAQTFIANQPYDIEIPSVEQTGLQVPTAHFTVGATAEAVVVLFDPTATAASIGVGGGGKVHMSPVLHEADAETEAAHRGETEDESDEESSEESDDESDDESSGSGSASLFMGPIGSVSAAQIAGDISLSMLPPGNALSADDVASLRLVLCEVRAIRKGSDGEEGTDSEDEGETEEGETEEGSSEAEEDAGEEAAPCLGATAGAGWTVLPLESAEIDFWALADGEVAEVAAGALPAGEYHNIRLYFSGAWVTLNTDVTIGGQTVLAGTEMPLKIPGAQNSGLKIPASHFDVVADAESAAVLQFDRSSASSLKITGQSIQMSPILREAPASVEEEVTTETEST